MLDVQDYRLPIVNRPAYFKGGELKILLPQKLNKVNDEIALGLKLIANRPLFGECYRILNPDYFECMPKDSGVFICGLIRTSDIAPSITFPGDIDLLIIPYESNELVLSQTLAIELKAIRALFSKQGKSPNQFGLSQASGLLNAGFPYAGIGHLIVSDKSPKEAWRELGMTTILDATGRAAPLKMVLHDSLPMNLIDRAHGRLDKLTDKSITGIFV